MMSMKHIIKKRRRRTSRPSPSETVKIKGTTNFSNRIRILSILIQGRWTSRRTQGIQRKKQISMIKMDGKITTISSPKDLEGAAEAKACVIGTSLKKRRPNLHNIWAPRIMGINIVVLRATIPTRHNMRHPTMEARVNGTDQIQTTISTASPNHSMHQCQKNKNNHSHHRWRIMSGKSQRSLPSSILIIINLIQKKHHLD